VASCAGMRLAMLVALALVAALVPSAHAAGPPKAWPPPDGPGRVVAHYGEEHWNDPDGKVLLSKVVEDVARYRPALVTMSGDKANNGTPQELEPWLEIMQAYDREGIPWLAGVGNHDRDLGLGEDAANELGGTSPAGDLSKYQRVFAGRPYPMGDAPPYDAPGFAPRERPADDPAGAASHFYVDVPGARFIFIDNSCQSITNCDALQNPPDGDGRPQYDYLRDRAREAKEGGRLAFVVMHQPTRDPGDQSYRKETARMHTMAKGATPDNALFEQVASESGIDGVFLAHIKGQFEYSGQGGVRYFIDGGAGGALYTKGPVGTDHGYWHGYRLIRLLDDGRWTSQAVPILTPGSVQVQGPDVVRAGSRSAFAGTGSQPVKNHTAKVDALELRDPAPVAPASAGLPPALLWLAPGLLVGLVAAGRARPRRRVVAAFAAACALGGGSLAAAQQSAPTATPADALPNPARIWTSADPRVLAPAASDSEDPLRDPRSQTSDGAFEGRCPGRTTVWLTSGWETAAHAVHVPSEPGRVVRRIRAARKLKRGRSAVVARVGLPQAAILRVRVRRPGGRAVTLRNRCSTVGPHAVRWKPRRRGTFRLEVVVASDRKPVVRRFRLRVR
jgi:hypothetical protein